MIPTCPDCHSHQVQHCHYGKYVGGTIGTIAGAVSGASGAAVGALEGASIGASAMRFAGPVGTASGAVVGAITGGLIGCVAGIRLGDVFDRELFYQYRCDNCGGRSTRVHRSIRAGRTHVDRATTWATCTNCRHRWEV